MPFEAEALLPPSTVYMQPRHAASDSIVNPNTLSSMSPTTSARMFAPVHKPNPSMDSTAATSSRPMRPRGDSIAEVPSAAPTDLRDSRYDAPPDYGT